MPRPVTSLRTPSLQVLASAFRPSSPVESCRCKSGVQAHLTRWPSTSLPLALEATGRSTTSRPKSWRVQTGSPSRPGVFSSDLLPREPCVKLITTKTSTGWADSTFTGSRTTSSATFTASPMRATKETERSSSRLMPFSASLSGSLSLSRLLVSA